MNRSTKLINLLARLISKKEDLNKTRNERGAITIDTTEILYEQLYINKLDNLENMDKFQETYNIPRLNREKNRKVIYKFSAILIKISSGIFREILQTLLKFV